MISLEEFDRIRPLGESLEFGDGEHFGGGSKDENGMLVFARTSTGKLMADDAKGKTVRQLSRLWRFQGGRTPDDAVKSQQVSAETPP